MKSLFALIILSISIAQTLPGQSILKPTRGAKPCQLGWTETIVSKELGEERTINIYLPEGYSPDSATTYPVIYLLDGAMDEDFVHMAGLIQFSSFSWVNRLEPSILVGIANTDRKRDLTYKAKEGYKLPDFASAYQEAYARAGGSEKFIAFIEKELMPFMTQNYKVGNHTTLIGQSLAGLFATEVLLKKTSLFDRYIIMSPSLWWDNNSMLQSAESLVARMPSDQLEVYIAVGKEGKEMEGYAKQLAHSLSKYRKSNLMLQFEYLKVEDHGTILHQATSNAFRFFSSKNKTK
jgi:uncharacterized protein